MLTRIIRAVILAAVLVPTGTGLAMVHGYKLGSFRIGHLWAPPSEAGHGVPVYGAILNMGKASVTLAGATAEIGKDVRVRRLDHGEAAYSDTVSFLPGKPLAFAKWREHLFVEDNSASFYTGDHFKMTLDFAKAGKIDVEVLVEATPSD
ncbi:copper chaperone PCu(A)C [Breoghania sp.]|uniref:copper chaperone PCu(A)C n=1 Tax=Breoghania sp. TaxID=2065378 RepID=UPI002635DC3D|nr:copper chaperone PCu(A)C [Breoghania sp.]MDJ0931211.1 hypothetical protein [Breoghania sp.]